MADADQSFEVEVSGTIEGCMEVLADFEAYPSWCGPIRTAAVLERYPDGRGRVVEFTLDMMIRTVRYVLEYEYTDEPGADWHMVDGDVSSIVGGYRFSEIAAGRCLARCHQTIDLGFWVPGPIRRIAEQQALRDSVMEFKAEVERRAGS